MKRIKLESVKTITGKEFRIPDINDEPADGEVPKTFMTSDLVELLKVIVFSIPRQKITMQDSIHGSNLYRQLQQVEDEVLAIEDGEYTWLKKTVDDYASMIYGVSAANIKEALENLIDREGELKPKPKSKTDEE